MTTEREERLSEALRFYADLESYSSGGYNEEINPKDGREVGYSGVIPVLMDNGKKARAALNVKTGDSIVTGREMQLELENANLREALKRCADGLGAAYGFAINDSLDGPYHRILSTPSPDPSPVLRLAAHALRHCECCNFAIVEALTPEDRALLEGIKNDN